MTIPDLIIFDFDGVLCRAEAYTPDAIRIGLRRFGESLGVAIPEPSEEVLLGTLGYPSRQTYPPLLPEAVRDRWQEMHAFTLSAMEERIEALGPACLYAGVPELLDDLVADQRVLGMASNCSLRYQTVHRRVHELSRWFRHLCHAEQPGIASKADMVGHILAAEPGARQAVMVGDRASDGQAAEAHGLPFVACSYGYGAPSEWQGAVAIVDSPAALGRTLGLA
jgi:phosphoglycolate phosphatase